MSLYFDYNATYPISAELMRAVSSYVLGLGNPSAIHGYGRKARQVIDDARFAVASALNCTAEQIIFTSGGTEANNMALVMARDVMPEDALFLFSAIEHPSIIRAAEKIFRHRLQWIPVNAQGIIDLDFVKEKLASAKGRAFISVMYANNETGVIQPIEELVKFGREYDALIHCDAVQALGKITVDFKALGVDMLSISGHKIGAFPGTGALLLRKQLDCFPLLSGGGQEKGRRAGTENLMGICSLGLKIKELEQEIRAMQSLEPMRDLLEKNMCSVLPDLIVAGSEVARLPNSLMVVSPRIRGDVLVITLDLDAIAVSTGSACASGKIMPSHVLQAMGMEAELCKGALRISMGPHTTEADVAVLFEAWKKNCRAAHRHPELVSGSKEDAENLFSITEV